MEKYKYKCDNEACNHVFVAENPTNCPKCGCDDFIIIGEAESIWPKVIFGIGLIGIVVLFFLLLRQCNETENVTETTTEINDDAETPDGTKKSIVIEYKVIDNYIKVISPEESDYIKLNFRLVHLTEGDEIYREGNKFYPCDEADYLFKWENTVDLSIIDDNKKINNFKFNNTSPHKNACEEVLEYVKVSTNSDCRYTVSTNLENNKIEVSLKENSGYMKGKVKWSFSEAGSKPTFYVRKIGSDNIKIVKKECKEDCPDPDKKDVINSFNLFKQNIEENDKQFYDIFGKCHPKTVIIKGEEIGDFNDFIMHLSIENMNTDGAYSRNLSLSESGVIKNNKNKVIKLIIK